MKGAVRHGGKHKRMELVPGCLTVDDVPPEVLDLDQALHKLAEEDPVKARLVTLRFFGGLSVKEAASILGMSTTTADRHWDFARAWLYRAMDSDTALDA